jgi:hypothetical protein
VTTTAVQPLRVAVFTLGYFTGVFAAAFCLGVVRTLYVEPALGRVDAELLEAPFLLGVIGLAAWIVVKCHHGPRVELAIVGAFAALLVLLADFGVGVFVRGLSPYEVAFARDPLTGAVYYGLIVLFGVAPYAIALPDRGRDDVAG